MQLMLPLIFFAPWLLVSTPSFSLAGSSALLSVLGSSRYQVQSAHERLPGWLARLPSAVERTRYLSVVVIGEQKNYIFDNDQLIRVYPVSTGARDRDGENHELPEALWRIGKKIDQELAPIYGPRLMYLEVWSGKGFEETTRAFHGTNEPENIGQPTSLGCVNHYNQDILKLYDLLPGETLVLSVYQ